MSKVEVNPVTIILAVLSALIIGIVTGAVGVGKFLTKKFKKLITELRETHKNDLKEARQESKRNIKRKNEIISKQQNIIDQLLDLFHVKDEKGRCIADTTLGRFSYNKIMKQRSRIN